MSSSGDFVHLHLHSSYSLLDGAVRIPDLLERVNALGMPAVAITDHGNMFGAVDFYKKAIAAGIKPILGVETYVAPRGIEDKTERNSWHLVLLARNDEGYRNLKYLVSKAYVDGFYYKPRIDHALLGANSGGLIGATACLGGEVPQAFLSGGYERARDAARNLAALFEPGCFFLEVQSNGYPEQPAYNDALRRIGQELGLPLLATNDVHYLRADDARAHNVLMCIQKGITLDDPKNLEHKYSEELYLRDADEMRAALRHFPDAVENTLRVAEMCGGVSPTSHKDLPDFPVPEGETLEQHLRNKAHAGLNRRFEEFERAGRLVDKAAYRARLDHEVDVISEMNYPGYFLIVHDFIDHAKRRGVPVGPGRGSGAGSLAAYALRITDIDPIPLGLLFERFLNPERVSMPDFDIDFCKDRRREVIEYVVGRYGENNVGQIATFHTLKGRSAVRDVGRVMGMTYGEVDRIAKLVPPDDGKTSLAEILESDDRLKAARRVDPRVAELLGLAARLEGLSRHAGMHAAGVVIGNRPLWEYVPVFRGNDKDQMTRLASQFDMNFVEEAGLIKFDFLGLKTLTVIDSAVRLIGKRPGSGGPPDIHNLPLDDEAVYRLISSGDTWGVFQLESRGFQELLRRLKPDCFEDIVAAVALYRPGPLEGGMLDQFIECKHGRRAISYPHPRLEQILRETYGVIVYQEQVMQAAQLLAGFSLGAADIMRRAMGKKKDEEMVKISHQFLAGCQEQGIDPRTASDIFDLIHKFAGYGFNKSHSAAYALLAYQTAWLKTHYPAEFAAAILTNDSEETDKIARYIRVAREAGIAVRPPDINRSLEAFSVDYEGGDPARASILFGLGAIKGVGNVALAAVIETREQGPYADIFDFACRVDLGKVNKAVAESLIKAGAFDSTTGNSGGSRGQVFGALDRALEQGRAAQRDRMSGQTSLFGDMAGGSTAGAGGGMDPATYRDFQPWSEMTMLVHEKTALGLYMSGHPMERQAEEAARLATCNSESVQRCRRNDKVTLAGMVMDLTQKQTQSGKRLGLFALEDLSGRVEVVVYEEKLARFGEVLAGDEPVLVGGTVRIDERDRDEKRSVILDEVFPLREVRVRRTREVRLHVDAACFRRDAFGPLRELLERHPGRCDAFLEVVSPGRFAATIALPETLRLAPSDELLDDLRTFDGISRVELR